MSAQTKPTITERLKSLWDSYGIEVLKFGTVGGAAFIVNSCDGVGADDDHHVGVPH